jgi:hypothetical protein
MDELTGRYDRGALSVRSLLDGKAESFDVETQRKLAEIKMQEKEAQIFAPAYDCSHGIVDGGEEGGRPSNGTNPTKPEGAVGAQQGRPSRGV